MYRLGSTRSRKQRNLAAAIAAASLFLSAGAQATGAQAATGGFGLSPAHFDPSDPVTRSYFKPSVGAGKTFRDEVIVSNTSDATIDFFVSGVDGLTGETSGAVYANRQDPVLKTASWLRADVSTLSVPAHGQANVGFAVQVPPDAWAGDHLAGVAFENAHPTNSGGQLSVTQVVRAVIGVLVRVPGPALPFHVQITGVSAEPLIAGSDLASFVIRFGDDGHLLGKPDFTVSVNGPNGYHRSLGRHLDTILPSDSIPFHFPWPDALRPGNYRVCVTAIEPSMQPVNYCQEVSLDRALSGVPAAGAPQAAVATASPWWLLLLMMIAGLLIGVLLVLFILRLSRRRRRQTEAEGT
jgi:hypothetical protein